MHKQLIIILLVFGLTPFFVLSQTRGPKNRCAAAFVELTSSSPEKEGRREREIRRALDRYEALLEQLPGRHLPTDGPRQSLNELRVLFSTVQNESSRENLDSTRAEIAGQISDQRSLEDRLKKEIEDERQMLRNLSEADQPRHELIIERQALTLERIRLEIKILEKLTKKAEIRARELRRRK